MTSITPESILQVASGFMAAKHLFVANEIGLFDNLASGPATLDSLAESTGIARPQVRTPGRCPGCSGTYRVPRQPVSEWTRRRGIPERRGTVRSTTAPPLLGPSRLSHVDPTGNGHPNWPRTGHHGVIWRTAADLFGGGRGDTGTER
jgi:hypothetical protein